MLDDYDKCVICGDRGIYHKVYYNGKECFICDDCIKGVNNGI